MDAEEEERLKRRFRKIRRSVTELAVVVMVSGGLFLWSVQRVLREGLSSGSYIFPLVLLAGATFLLLLRRKWILAGVCALVMIFSAYYLRKAAEIVERRKALSAELRSTAPAASAARASGERRPRSGTRA